MTPATVTAPEIDTPTPREIVSARAERDRTARRREQRAAHACHRTPSHRR